MEIDIELDILKYKIHKFYQNSQDVVQFHKNDIKALEEIIKRYEKLKDENKSMIEVIQRHYISKDEIRKFETDIYGSYDYDMGVSESFIKFLEEKEIIERN